MIKISVVIPTLNEARAIAEVVAGVPKDGVAQIIGERGRRTGNP
jgi:hypothetical protein